MDEPRANKYKLSSSDLTPSPKEKTFAYRNYAYSNTSSTDDQNRVSSQPDATGPQGEEEEVFHTGASKHAYDNVVFTHDYEDINNVRYVEKNKYDSSTLTRHKNQPPDAGEGKSDKKVMTRGFLIYLAILTVLGIITAIVVVVVVRLVRDESASTTYPATTAKPGIITLYGFAAMNKSWDPDLSNSSSLLYKETADNFTALINEAVLKSENLSSIYSSAKVISMSPGSILVRFTVDFLQNYTKYYTDIEELSVDVKDVIMETSQSNSTLNIITQSISINSELITTPAPTVTTETTEKTSSMSTTEKTPTMSTTDKTPTMSTTDKTPTMSTTEKTPTMSTTEKTPTMSTTEKTPTMSTTEKTPTMSTTEKTPTMSTTEKTPTMSTTEKTPTMSTTEKTPTMSTTEKTPTMSTTEKTPTMSTTEKTPTMSTTEKTPTMSTTEKTPTMSTTEKTPTMSTTEKTPTMSTTEKTPFMSTTEKTPTMSTTEKTPTMSTTEALTSKLTSTTTYTTQKTTEKEPLTTTEPTSTPSPGLCMEVEYTVCRDLGYTETVFPNIFGFTNQSQAIAFMTKLLPNACTGLATEFMCSIFFPKCNTSTGYVTLPCSDFCHAVYTQCGNVLGSDIISIEYLCPVMPSEDCHKPQIGLCMDVTHRACRNLGYNTTVFPNILGMNIQPEAVTAMEQWFPNACTEQAKKFMCSVLFPKCDQDTGHVIYPCQDFCQGTYLQCGDIFNASYGLEKFCPNLPTHKCEIPEPEMCMDVGYQLCRDLGYNSTMFPNILGMNTQSEAIAAMGQFLPNACTEKAKKFMCSMLFPKCDQDTGLVIYPCQDFCEDAWGECGNILEGVDFEALCPSFQTQNCTRPEPELCVEVGYSVCKDLGYKTTMFPNMFGHNTQQEAKAAMEMLLNNACTLKEVKFLCATHFPVCDSDTGRVMFPCQNFCQDVLNDCGPSLLGDNVTLAAMCPNLPQDNCWNATEEPGEQCETVLIPECQALNFTVTKYPTPSGYRSQEEAIAAFNMSFRVAIDSQCSEHLGLFVCSILTPNCSKAMLPCKHFCEVMNQDCSSVLPNAFDCSNFIEYTSPASCIAPELFDNCLSNQTSCYSENKCINNSQLCDRQLDCRDWSDESSCSCDPVTEHKCAMGLCIPALQRCDGTSQCPDNSDEYQCVCPLGQHACRNGKCIMREWLCDGDADCDDLSDEINCNTCGSDQFTCLDGACITSDQVCDSIPHCPDESDERECLKSGPGDMLMLYHPDGHVPVCMDGWGTMNDDPAVICKRLGQMDFMNVSTINYSTSNRYALLDKTVNQTSYIGPMRYVSSCPESKVVAVHCELRACGRRNIVESPVAFIIGGDDAALGAWPWQVSIQVFSNHVCGGSIISKDFVITATHCVPTYFDKSHITVVVGITDRTVADTPSREVYKVKRIIRFDDSYVMYQPGDITLLELEHSVGFNAYVQPVCLVSPNETISRTSICYASGWGRTEPIGDYSPTLKEVKMKLWSTEKCNSSAAWNGTVTGSYLCAGYESGIKSVCKGDSGGPLVCKDNFSVWKLVGISSYVSSYCNWTSRPNVFTDVQYYSSWIAETTRCKFQCYNGKCLYDESMLCNRVDDCGDNSDENFNCPTTVNCTFDNYFLCGYEVDGFSWVYGSNQSEFQTFLPISDATVGRWPGRYLLGGMKNGQPAMLASPYFTVSESSCLRFQFNVRGHVTSGLVANVYKENKPYRNKTFTKGAAESRWYMGYFDLSPGEYNIEFVTSEEKRVGIDNIEVHTGLCANSLCLESEFFCNNTVDSEKSSCIPAEQQCNIQRDCPNDVDIIEMDRSCIDFAANTFPSYSCDFENNFLCNLEQTDIDAGDFILGNGSQVTSILFDKGFNDHTTGVPSGFMMYLFSTLFLENDFVSFRQTLQINRLEYCLSFYYYAETDATFDVIAENLNLATPLWTFDSGSSFGWAKAQIILPLATDDLVLEYKVYQKKTRIPHIYPIPFLAIDDITISFGKCPAFECPDNFTKCNHSDFCYPLSAQCDRVVHCPIYDTDEWNCNCTSEEFRCNYGRCIPIDKKCDGTMDCGYGSDESEVCDIYRNVTCDFDTTFKCGYSPLITSDSKYRWSQIKGPTPTSYTGPSADHTKGNYDGMYMYARGSEGTKGETTSITSPMFNTTANQSLSFYYHMYSSIPSVRVGAFKLQLLVFLPEPYSSQTLFSTNQTTANEWTFVCVDLPENAMVQIRFAAEKNEIADANDPDIAVDDVVLRNSACRVAT